MNTEQQQTRITSDDNTTLDELYREQWFEQLSPEQQALALLHQLDQFEAVPSYLERERTTLDW